MTRLSVNINKLATLRNARGGANPDVIAWARKIEDFGAEGITVHPRPDERHIRRSDVAQLSKTVRTEFNIEGYPSPDFVELVIGAKPTQVTLVPDPPQVLTSNAGWDVKSNRGLLNEVLSEFKEAGIRTSLFMEPNAEHMQAAKDVGTDRIELYTESYARGYIADRESAVHPYARAAEAAVEVGLGVNAGHDLDLQNLKFFNEYVDGLDEVSIGHALICDALIYGMENTVQLYLRELK